MWTSTRASHVATSAPQPRNDLGVGVPLSDSAISKAMRTCETPGEVATKLGEGLYSAQQPPPAMVRGGPLPPPLHPMM